MLELNQKRHMADLMFMIALFCVFISSALFVVLIGANVYQKTAGQADQADTSRMALLYLTEKIHQNDAQNVISLGKADGQDALLLEQDYNGTAYITYIYSYDGYLRELFVEKGQDIAAQDGQAILQLKELRAEEGGNGTYRFTSVGLDGDEHSVWLSSRCQVERGGQT